MIPRSLVPRNVRPASEMPPAAPPRRLTTLLDERTVVAANLPRAELQTHSNIPAHLPLDVLASRTVVPRDTPATPFDPAMLHPDYAPATLLDERVTVPVALPVVELESKGPVSRYELPDVLDPDVLTTGDVNLMVAPVETPPRDWNWLARAASIGFHILFITFLLLQAKLFPYRPPTQSQIDLARQQLNFIYMPPDVRGLPRTPPAPRGPVVRVDPRILRQIAPPVVPQPMPAPRAPEKSVRDTPTEPPPDLPVAPKPQPQQQQAQQPDTRIDTIKPQPQTEAQNHLILPQFGSPARMRQEAEQQSRQSSGTGVEGFGGRLPGGALPGYGGGGGGGSGEVYGGVQMLTPDQGVNFNDYLARVVASVKRNWYAVMPESVYLGEKGKVMLRFRIMANGSVPEAEPLLEGSSGKEPLDRAAFSSIRASSPFEPLPSAFSGPFIELRFIFLYNLPLSAAQ
ncbi:MAG TPA: TonB C-terminal domain-containing protein [Candidatus Acidoferrales bacterium]|jgi:TonB family protein|nr:TonB C-terminal domain-containing protein [Candidatus Acidoferrales bacterium]